MSDVFDIVRSQRPDVPALDDATRTRLRARATGESDPDAGVDEPLDHARNGDHGVEHDATPRHRWIAVAAVALTLAGVVGVWAGANRPDEPPPLPVERPSDQPRPATTGLTDRPANAGPPPSGAMILDRLPPALANATGYSYVGTAEAELPFPDRAWIQRWYTTTMDQPERQPRLKLASTSSTQPFAPAIPPAGVDATPVTVRGATAWLYDDPASRGRTVAFEDSQTAFVLTGYQLGDDELLTAADHTRLAGDSSIGAVIDAPGLPTGLVERAVGLSSEEPFVPLESLQHAPASVRWYNAQPDGALPGDDGPMLWLGWRVEDPDLFPLYRLAHDDITDTTVRGAPAFITASDVSSYVGVHWSEGGHTYTLGGWGLTPETVLDAADRLRPSTNADWAALTAEPS